EETIRRFITYFKGIMQKIFDEPHQKIGEIEIITEEEKNRILYEFNETAVDYPREKTIHQLFGEQVERTPDSIALVGNWQYAVGKEKPVGSRQYAVGKKKPASGIQSGIQHPASGNQSFQSTQSTKTTQLTYRELNQKSNQLAAQIIQKGVQPGTIVAIMPEQTAAMIIGIIGILKAGAAYLAIDTEYPEERIQYMLKDSNAKLVLKEKKEKQEIGEGVEIIDIQSINKTISRPQPQATKLHPATGHLATGVAYIIYTSGTTGQPKGVMVEHRSVVRLVTNTNYIEFNRSDRLLQTGPLSFDASTFEIWGTLENGLTLYQVKKEEILSTANLKEKVKTFGIDIIWMTSALFNHHVQEDIGIFKGIKQILVGGDVVTPGHVNRLRKENPGIRITNGYGPTENTTFSTSLTVEKEYIDKIPIGKPISNSTAYIVNKSNRLCPVGVPGELLVGGDGLARGYLNQPELTAERFVKAGRQYAVDSRQKEIPNTQKPITNNYLYRTGDRASWQADGTIQYLGRMDRQVKIRGYRIEPGEIENHILTHEAVKEAVVLVKQDPKGDKHLCAYIVKNQPQSTQSTQSKTSKTSITSITSIMSIPSITERIQQYLSQKLPNYMIPAHIIPLEKIPITPNGKTDHKALAQIPLTTIQSPTRTAPRNVNEKKLRTIWAEVLGTQEKEIAIDDNFFEIGGHSLRATTLAARIHKEFDQKVPLTEIFKKSTIRALASSINENSPHTQDKYHAIEPVEKKEYYNLSSAQKRLYFLQQMEGTNTVYNMPLSIPLPKEIQPAKLERAFKKLIQRHESLRTSFHMLPDTPGGGTPVTPGGVSPVQKVHDDVEFKIENYNQPGDGDAYSGEAGIKDEKETFFRHFDLSRAPLLRVAILQKEPAANTTRSAGQEAGSAERILQVDMHHIITDGTSQEVLIKEISALFAGESFAPLKLQYKDYADWQNGAFQKQLMKQQETFWIKRYTGELPVLELPTDYPRPVIQSFEGKRETFVLNTQTTAEIKQISKESKATLYMTIHSIFTIMISKLSGQQDIIVGTPTAGRRHTELENIIGMFVNTLAMRNYPGGDKNYREYLYEVKEHTLQAFENQDYQFEELVEKLSIRRDPGRNPIFDVMLSHIDIAIPGSDKPKKREKNDTRNQNTKKTISSKFDLTLDFNKVHEELKFTIEYSVKLFKKETIRRFISYLKNTAAAILSNPETRLKAIDILPPQEKKRLVIDFNGNTTDYPGDKTLQRIFEEQVDRTPANIALIDYKENRRRQLDYRQLNEKAANLAGELKNKGVETGTIAGIQIEPSIEMMIAILAVLKAGAAYVPIAPDNPAERNQYIIKDSGMTILLTTRNLTGTTPLTKETVYLEESIWSEAGTGKGTTAGTECTSTDPAYIIYTSGTTGRPKGVIVEHRNVTAYLEAFYREVKIEARHTIVQQSIFTFDIFIEETFSIMMRGGTIAIPGREIILDIDKLIAFIRDNNVNIIDSSPLLLNQLNQRDDIAGLELFISGGDVLKREYIHRLLEAGPVYNTYGPTETTVAATFFRCAQNEAPPSIYR
ncbi:MAG: amino acid adenylation domain-containing protein, partial [bacterium]|nr:amino acid adenylation domain-containing protein [bacterium]